MISNRIPEYVASYENIQNKKSKISFQLLNKNYVSLNSFISAGNHAFFIDQESISHCTGTKKYR